MACIFKSRQNGMSNIIKKPFHPSLIFDSVHLKEVESHKQLAVVYFSNLTWNLHIEEVVEKAYSRLGILRRVKYNLDRRTLQKIKKIHSSDRFQNMPIFVG